METEFPWNFEQEPWLQPHDETDVNLRSYFDRMPQQKMSEYRPPWSDDQVMEWDGNFRSDGALFLICSERDVEVGEYRRVLEQCLEYRARVARAATNSNAE
jgi:hypothetical protein